MREESPNTPAPGKIAIQHFFDFVTRIKIAVEPLNFGIYSHTMTPDMICL